MSAWIKMADNATIESAKEKFYQHRRDNLTAPTESAREWKKATDELMEDLGCEPYLDWLKSQEK